MIRGAELECWVQAVGLLLPALPSNPCRLPAGCSDAPFPLEKKKSLPPKKAKQSCSGKKAPPSKWLSHQNLCLLGGGGLGGGGVQLGAVAAGRVHGLCRAGCCFGDQLGTSGLI